MRGLAILALAAAWAVAALFLWRTRVPSDLHLPHLDSRVYFDRGLIRRSEHFGRFLELDWIGSQVAIVAVFAAYARWGARLTRESAAGRIGTGMLLAMLGFALVWLAQLPFGVAGLWWERRYHVSRLGYGEWALQNWISLGGVFLFVCFAILVVMGFAGPLRDRWWLAGGPFFVALALLFAFVQPYILPGLHPLRDPPLAAEAHTLADKEGLPPIPIRVQYVHTFTSAPNAEAAGLGASRRVILWDTLLDGRFSFREERVVLAHELGHLSRNHIWKQLGWYALFALPGAYLIARATRRRGGMHEAEAVPVALFVLVVLQLAALPLENAISRHIEAEADWVALQTTRDPAAAQTLFQDFGKTALEEPQPSTWSYLLLENHPTLMQRIAMSRAWRARQSG